MILNSLGEFCYIRKFLERKLIVIESCLNYLKISNCVEIEWDEVIRYAARM